MITSTAYNSEPSVPAVLRALREEGYTCDFEVCPGGRVRCMGCDCEASARDLRVERVERFEGVTNPGDEALLIAGALPGAEGPCRGVLALGYGPSAAPEAAEVLEGLDLSTRTTD